MIAVQECLRFWERNNLAVVWNPKNLEYAVKTANYMEHARLSGIAAKKEKRIFAVGCVIFMMIV